MRKYAAEFIAAFFLVFAGVSAIIADQHLGVVLVRQPLGILGIALAHGLALAAAIAAVARISGGHANPAVSIAFFVARRISGKDLAGYLAAQFAGGIVAAFLAKLIYPAAAVAQTKVGALGLGDQVKAAQAVGIEAALTFLLVFVVWGVAVDRRGPKALAPFAIGLTVTAAILAGGAFTGAGLNPARWLGPALAGNSLGNAAVWLAGPILGALLASLLYEMVFLNAEEEEGEAESATAAVADEAAAQRQYADTPSPMVPPSGLPKPAGEPSSMKPPPPPAAEPVETPRPAEPSFPAPPAAEPSLPATPAVPSSPSAPAPPPPMAPPAPPAPPSPPPAPPAAPPAPETGGEQRPGTEE